MELISNAKTNARFFERVLHETGRCNNNYNLTSFTERNVNNVVESDLRYNLTFQVTFC